MKRVALCFDIGGSKYNVGLVDSEGTILAQSIGKWTALTEEAILHDLFGCADTILARHPEIRPVAAGATIPGLADRERGLWVEASFSGIRNFAVADCIGAHYRMPVFIDNDAQACALAEKMFGCCKETNDFVYLTVSNGVGGAFVLDGRPYGGASQGAGEIGHCVVAEGGRPCGCGSRGCLEAYAAGPAISKNYLELGGQPGRGGGAPSAKEIAERARLGEQTAIDTFRLEGEYLGRAVAFAVNLLNPEKVVIGGGVSLAFDLFGPSLNATVREHIYRKANSGLSIVPSVLGYNGGLYGAAVLAFS